MTNRIITLAGALLLMLAACTSEHNQEKEEKKANEESKIEDTNLQKVEDKQAEIAAWQQYYQLKMPDFGLNNFQVLGTQKVNDLFSGMKLNETFYHRYGKLLVYSPDSTRFIDIYSYNFIAENEKDGSVSLRMGEPDQEGAVVDTKTGKRLRLWFCGPHCLLEKAIWLNNDEVALMGIADEDGNELYQPHIWVVNTKSGQTTIYTYPDEVNELDPVEFTRQTLRGKGIKYDG